MIFDLIWCYVKPPSRYDNTVGCEILHHQKDGFFNPMNNGIIKPSINLCRISQPSTVWYILGSMIYSIYSKSWTTKICWDSPGFIWPSLNKGANRRPIWCPWGSDIPHDSLCAVLAARNRCRNGASKPPSSLRCMSHTWSIYIYILIYQYIYIYIYYIYRIYI